MKKVLVCSLIALMAMGCGNGKVKTESGQEPAKPAQPAQSVDKQFNGDSAYAYVARQVEFGPRVPGSDAHRLCGDYLVSELQRYGAVVEEQEAEARLYNGKKMKFRNIIGHFNPDAKRRVLLSAHWDTRPFSDQENNESLWNTPIDGANDGASGVGVLLEMARQLQTLPLSVGVDIVFFDLEDWGTPEFHEGVSSDDSYCLGSQYWAKNIAGNRMKPEAGILLDMVGAPGARFYQEQVSNYYAPEVLRDVWHTAAVLGFDNYFVSQRGGAVTDDHLYVNQLAGIPTIDIIQYDPTSDSGFGSYWHTQKDNMTQIDKTTLYVVGQTLLQYLINYQ